MAPSCDCDRSVGGDPRPPPALLPAHRHRTGGYGAAPPPPTRFVESRRRLAVGRVHQARHAGAVQAQSGSNGLGAALASSRWAEPPRPSMSKVALLLLLLGLGVAAPADARVDASARTVSSTTVAPMVDARPVVETSD